MGGGFAFNELQAVGVACKFSQPRGILVRFDQRHLIRREIKIQRSQQFAEVAFIGLAGNHHLLARANGKIDTQQKIGEGRRLGL